jgi:predicted AlkP superfamily pyrophosphatase or phosphodiesterase
MPSLRARRDLLPRISLFLIILLLVATGCATAPASHPRGPDGFATAGKSHVILVSFDGFRADYLDRYPTPGFERVMRAGTRAKALLPVFPTKTFPNHFTLVTGLYTEHHGIVANSFWDPARRQTYALGDQETVTDGTWYRGEPIWVTAEKQGVKAACFFWPGSEAEIGGVRPTYWNTYDHDIPNAERVDRVLEWLRLPELARPRMITLYFSDVDSASHEFAPLTPGTATAVNEVDAALVRLLDGLRSVPVRDDVYLVLVSDHGMAETGLDRITALNTLIDTRDMTIADAGPTANLHIPGGAARAAQVRDELNAKLNHGRAYLRSEVPERLHYRADPRIGDVVVIMDEHYMVSRERRDRPPAGMHGWDPAVPSMHGIFLVSGPGIPGGATVGPVEAIDVYPFLAELLGITPAKRIDGRPGRIRQALSQPAPRASRLTPVP